MAEWQSGDVIANGIRIHYYRTGGGKPPVVLCHGYTDNGLCWTPVARRLEVKYDVIMLDARGHGLSEAVEDDYDVRSMAADVIGAIQALGLDKPVVMGHSMGGSMATFAATMAPNAIGAVILEDPGYLNPPEKEPTAEEQAEHLEGFTTWVEGLRTKTAEELIAQCRIDSPTWPEDELGPWAESKQQMNPNIAKMNISGGVTWQSVVPGIKLPGTCSSPPTWTSTASSRPRWRLRRSACCPTMEVAHIAGVGHNIRREGREAFLKAVEAFLARWAR